MNRLGYLFLLLALVTQPLVLRAEPGESIRKTPGSMVTDPLAWLAKELSCEAFLEQVKIRYEPLAGLQSLPEFKEQEIGKVLDSACSPRFAQCDYPVCRLIIDEEGVEPGIADRLSALLASSVVEESAETSEEDIARERLKVILARWEHAHQRRIAAQIAKEQKDGLQWQRVSIEGLESDEAGEDDSSSRSRRSSSTSNAEIAERQQRLRSAPKPRTSKSSVNGKDRGKSGYGREGREVPEW